MKNLKMVVLAIFATVTMNAQDLKMADVPTNLMTTFQKTYPNATDVEWEMKGLEYNVEFDINKMEHEIWYHKDGSIVKSKKDIMTSELPSTINAAIKSKFAAYKIDSVEMRTASEKITYEVELEKGWSDERKVVFEANGRVLSDIAD